MAVVIDEMTTTLELEDEVKLRKLVREEITRALAAERRGVTGGIEVDPADPAAAGAPER